METKPKMFCCRAAPMLWGSFAALALLLLAPVVSAASAHLGVAED
jgi:hypothetical protein